MKIARSFIFSLPFRSNFSVHSLKAQSHGSKFDDVTGTNSQSFSENIPPIYFFGWVNRQKLGLKNVPERKFLSLQSKLQDLLLFQKFVRRIKGSECKKVNGQISKKAANAWTFQSYFVLFYNLKREEEVFNFVNFLNLLFFFVKRRKI